MEPAVLLFCLGMYFLPSIFAYAQNHHNKAAILGVNLFFGWTFVGWFVAAIWCSTRAQQPQPPLQQLPPRYPPYPQQQMPQQFAQPQQPTQQISPWNHGQSDSRLW